MNIVVNGEAIYVPEGFVAACQTLKVCRDSVQTFTDEPASCELEGISKPVFTLIYEYWQRRQFQTDYFDVHHMAEQNASARETGKIFSQFVADLANRSRHPLEKLIDEYKTVTKNPKLQELLNKSIPRPTSEVDTINQLLRRPLADDHWSSAEIAILQATFAEDCQLLDDFIILDMPQFMDFIRRHKDTPDRGYSEIKKYMEGTRFTDINQLIHASSYLDYDDLLVVIMHYIQNLAHMVVEELHSGLEWALREGPLREMSNKEYDEYLIPREWGIVQTMNDLLYKKDIKFEEFRDEFRKKHEALKED